MKILKVIANLYIYIIRGTPMFVQILIIYFGLGQMLRPTGFRWLNIGGGIFTLSLNAGAYMAEIFRGGIEAVDKGQIEAARSLGLTYGKTIVATKSAHMMVIYCFMAYYYLFICIVLAQVSKVVEKRSSYGK